MIILKSIIALKKIIKCISIFNFGGNVYFLIMLSACTLQFGGTVCPAGKYISENTCKYCEAGKQVSEEKNACIDCIPGKYKNIVSESKCNNCPSGRYIDTKGSGVRELPLLTETIFGGWADLFVSGFTPVPNTNILVFARKNFVDTTISIHIFDTMTLTTNELFSLGTRPRISEIPMEPAILSYDDIKKEYSFLLMRYNHCDILRIDITPVQSSSYLFAGNVNSASINGAPLDARFLHPTKIISTNDRKSIFIVDYQNIRKIDMTSFQNTVSTFAGSSKQQSLPGRPNTFSQNDGIPPVTVFTYIDGIGTAASFTQIDSICLTSNDLEILVLDYSIIRRIVIATAQVSTIVTNINGQGILDNVLVSSVFGNGFATSTLNSDDTILYLRSQNENVLKSVDLVNNIVKTIPVLIPYYSTALRVTSNDSILIYMNLEVLTREWKMHSIQIKNIIGCKACPNNSESAEGRTSCFCNSGFSGLHTQTCTKCTAGKYKLNEEDVNCQDCPANSDSEEERKNCLCNLGFFRPNGEICTKCETGKYKSDRNDAKCQNCIPNSNSLTGSTKLSECLCNTGFSRRNANECIQNINTAQNKYSLLINMVIGGSTLDISTEIIDAIQDQSSISFFVPIYRISRLELNANKGSTRRLLSTRGSFSIFSPSPQENSEIKSIVTVETLNSILSVASSNVISVLSASVEEVVIQELSPISKPAPDDSFDIGIILLVCFLVFFVFLCCFYFISTGKISAKTKSSQYHIFVISAITEYNLSLIFLQTILNILMN